MKQEALSTILPVPYSWTTIDSIQVPCFSRKERDYIPRRLVEESLLSHYPSNIDNISPLIGYHATEHEAETLNSLLATSSGSSATDDEAKYTTKDVLVSLEDFLALYDYLKRHLRGETSASGGWFQVNNIVIPYVERSGTRLVPLEILLHGGHILSSVNCIEYQVEALAEEIDYLNRIFKAGGFSYSLRPSYSKLINITLAWSLCEEKPRIRELPAGDDPMVHASFDDTAIVEVQSSISSADSDVEIISENIQVPTPILVAPSDDKGEDEIVCEAQGCQKIESSECDVVQSAVLQTPTTISHSMSLESLEYNSEVNFVINSRSEMVPSCGDVPVNANCILRNTGNGIQDFAGNLPNVCHELGSSAGPFTSACNELGNSANPLRNDGNGLSDSANYSKGKSAKRVNQASVGKERRKKAKRTVSTGSLQKKRNLVENAELIRKNTSAPSLSNGANIASDHSRVTPFNHGSNAMMSQFNSRAHEANPPVGGAMHPSQDSFSDASVRYNVHPYRRFPAHFQDSTYIHRSSFHTTSLAPASNDAAPYTPPTPPHYFQNTGVSDPPNCVASRNIETLSAQRNDRSGTVSSSLCYGDALPNVRNGLVSVQSSAYVPPHGSKTFPPQYNNMSTNETVSFFPGYVIRSHGNNMTPNNSDGCNPTNQSSIILSNQWSMTSKRSDVYSSQPDELPIYSCVSERNRITTKSRYLTGMQSHPPSKAFQPPPGHLYSGAMDNQPTYPNNNKNNNYNNQWDRQQSSSVTPPLTPSSLRNSLLHSSLPPVCFPIGNPLPMPPTYQTAVQTKGDASAGKGGIPAPTSQSSQPTGREVWNSQAICNALGYKHSTLVKQLANSACIVITPLFGKRVFSLWKNSTLYVLLESLQKTFCKDWSLESWLCILEVNWGIKTIALTRG